MSGSVVTYVYGVVSAGLLMSFLVINMVAITVYTRIKKRKEEMKKQAVSLGEDTQLDYAYISKDSISATPQNQDTDRIHTACNDAYDIAKTGPQHTRLSTVFASQQNEAYGINPGNTDAVTNTEDYAIVEQNEAYGIKRPGHTGDATAQNKDTEQVYINNDAYGTVFTTQQNEAYGYTDDATRDVPTNANEAYVYTGVEGYSSYDTVTSTEDYVIVEQNTAYGLNSSAVEFSSQGNEAYGVNGAVGQDPVYDIIPEA